MKKLIALMVLATMVLTGCNKDKITNLDEKIIGKWVVADKDGKSAPTNEKMVISFLSPSKAMVSASLNAHQGTKLWVNQQEADVVINGDKMTLTFHSDAHSTSVHEFTVTSINDNEFVAKQKVTVTVDGNVVISEEGTFRFVKVNADYRQDILGLWEGRMTSEESEYGDNDIHRWEFLPDGTRHYYHKVGNTWVPSDDEYAEYFVDGNTLELPRKGKRSTNGNIYYDGSDGEPAGASYWSGTAIDATYAWRLDSGGFASGVYVYDGKRGAGASIRFVK